MKNAITSSLLLLFWGISQTLLAQAGPLSPKPNVLFIAMDDLRPELNCYGQSFMQTPNLDRLAATGTTFRRAYCQQAICMASRASLLSGLRPEHRHLYNCGSLEALAPEVTTLNEHFAEHGYLIAGIGKVYHHREDHQAQFGDKWHDPTHQWAGRGYLTDEAIGEMAANGRFEAGKKPKGPAYEMADVPDNAYIDGANAEYAIEKLKAFQQEDQPFFLALGFHKPHLPWCAPKQYWDLYPADQVELSPAPDFPTDLTPYSLTNWGELRGYFGIPQGKDQVPDELAIQLRRAYYASVSYADAQLGKVLNALDELGLRESTIIVLYGDHGWKLGDHHAWSKHTNFEIDTRVPLIIRVPELTNGQPTEAFAELVDLYPTLCDLADLDLPSHLEGKSLVPLLQNPTAQVHEAAYSIFPRDRTEDAKTITGFSLRNRDFRYTEWIHLASGELKAAELYDHRRDSLENHNVAGEATYAPIVAQLASQLHQQFDGAIPGRAPAPSGWLFDPAKLRAAKARYQAQEEPYFSLVQELQTHAEALLDTALFAVNQNQLLLPPSGNPHDYYSLGPYWWPNPETEDGLPYIRKDGLKNPEYDAHDGRLLKRMVDAVYTLCLAHFYTGEPAYAAKANAFLTTWFLDSATYMNPHLEHGQAIPGIVEGRGIGIIETAHLLRAVNGMGLLQMAGSLPASTHFGMKDWIRDYTHWLVTSEKGWDERRWHNNHGSSYDSQVATFALFAGEDSLARLILDSVKVKRIDRQIEPDGSQPWELERTKSMSYSIKNLDHLMENAILAQQVGIDLWHYESADDGSIEQAIRFLIPYMLGEKAWPYEQYGGIEKTKGSFAEMIWLAHQHLDDPLIERAYEVLCRQAETPLPVSLLYPEG
jgi:iduronate 2-sulfatase